MYQKRNLISQVLPYAREPSQKSIMQETNQQALNKERARCVVLRSIPNNDRFKPSGWLIHIR